MIGIFANEMVIIRLVGAILLKQNDEQAVQHALDMSLESISPIGDHPLVGLSTLEA